jgi:hypothetical protein
VAAALAPVRTRPAQALVAPPPAPGAPLPVSALDVERDEARRAAAAAIALDDERFAQIAVDLDGTLRRLAAGKISDGDALEQLAALQRRAAEAAQDAAREGQALAAAQKALAAEAATRGASEALSNSDGDAGERARAALGSAAAESPKETARALAAAAQGVSSALGSQSDGNSDGKNQRRLSRPDDKNGANDGASEPRSDREGERRLERLQRDLGEASDACRAGDPSCRGRAEKSGGDLGRMAGRQQSTEALRRLERSLRQMRERLGRGEMRGGDQSAQRGFERAARGDNGQEQDGQGQGNGQGKGQEGREQQGDGVAGGEGNGETTADAISRDGKDGKGGKQGKGKGNQMTGLGEAMALIQERETEGNSSTGEGQGNGAGGPPLGERGDMQTRGRETEARVASGAGPNRAEVIGGAADRGFAQRGYARVFSDYQAAVEDALAASAVPEGRRYVVRRYFDLIRPRTGRTGKAER